MNTLSHAAASDCASLYAAVGQGFYVETPCESLRPGADAMAGTRITLLVHIHIYDLCVYTYIREIDVVGVGGFFALISR